jgi:hypothetical protein
MVTSKQTNTELNIQIPIQLSFGWLPWLNTKRIWEPEESNFTYPIDAKQSVGAKEFSVLSINKGRLFVWFVLFVMLRSPKPWCLLLHSWYHWKALDEWRCTKLVIYLLNLQWSRYWIWRWWKKLHQFDQVSKNGFLLCCCGLFPLHYWVTIVQRLLYVMGKASEAAKTPKLGLVPTHDSH